MPYYYVETMQGCGIRSATNIQQARKSALAESGSSNFKSIRKATKGDIEWVRAMGGYIPEMSRLTKRAVDAASITLFTFHARIRHLHERFSRLNLRH